MGAASVPALLASVEASSIEFALPQKLKSGTKRSLTCRNHDSLPDSDIPQDGPHASFHLGVDSSADIEFPVKQKKVLNAPHEYELVKQTYHSDSERKLPLMSSRQPACKPIRVFSKAVALNRTSTQNTLHPPV